MIYQTKGGSNPLKCLLRPTAIDWTGPMEKTAKFAGGIISLAVLGIACASAPSGRPAPSGSPDSNARHSQSLPIPAEMRQQVHNAEIVGRLLYTFDQMSAIAMDVLMEKFPDFRKRNIGGYLPFRGGDEHLRPTDSFYVIFYTRDEPARIAFDIRFRPAAKPELQSYDPPKEASPPLVRLIRARQTAINALTSYPQLLNPVLVPAALLGEKGTLVYLIAGTTKPKTAVFGLHYRVLIPEEGGTPSYVMPLSKGIFEMPIDPPGGEKAAFLWVTHSLTDWPLETHVFVSLLIKRPVLVKTSFGLWLVDGDKISLVKDKISARR
jgi:hypothetical protein